MKKPCKNKNLCLDALLSNPKRDAYVGIAQQLLNCIEAESNKRWLWSSDRGKTLGEFRTRNT